MRQKNLILQDAIKKNTSLFVGLVFFICAKCGRERGILRIEVI